MRLRSSTSAVQKQPAVERLHEFPPLTAALSDQRLLGGICELGK